MLLTQIGGSIAPSTFSSCLPQVALAQAILEKATVTYRKLLAMKFSNAIHDDTLRKNL